MSTLIGALAGGCHSEGFRGLPAQFQRLLPLPWGSAESVGSPQLISCMLSSGS